VTAAYEPEPAAAAAARRFVRETLRAWQVPDDSGRVVDDAVLLTSELVTNAIVHAGTPLEVTCRRHAGEIEVAVRDLRPTRTLSDSPLGADADRTGGRGLLLPAALASSWGLSYARTSKTIWFRIALDESTADGAAGSAGAVPTAAPAAAAPALPAVTAPVLASAAAAPPMTAVPAALAAGLDGARLDLPELAGLRARGVGSTIAWPAAGLLPQSAAGACTDHGPALAGQRDQPADLGRLGYGELLRHTLATAMEVTGADAACAVVPDEDGELRIKASAGGGIPQLLGMLAGPGPRHAEGTAHASAAGLSATGPQAAAATADEPVTDGPPPASVLTVPFLAENRVTGLLAAAVTEPGRFGDGAADRLQVVADRVGLSLERARLAEFERARRGRLTFLAEASDLLAGTLEPDKTVAIGVQLVVPQLATWCAAFLAEDGAARLAHVLHTDQAAAGPLARLLAAVPPPPLARAPARSWLWPLATAADMVWCCPLVARGRALGVLAVGWPAHAGSPRAALEMVEEIGARVALALDNARLRAQQMQTSKALRRGLLPSALPCVPGVDLAVEYAAAAAGGDEIGSDFYDVFAVAEGRWRFAVGDVHGSDPQAAAVTGLARYTMRILAHEGRGIAAVLDRLNRLILDKGPHARFVTLVHGEISIPGAVPGTATGRGLAGAYPGGGIRVKLICAGQPVPLLLRGAGAPQPAVRPQPLLGVLDAMAFRASSVDLGPGDMLLCVTDGVTGRRDGDRMLDDGDGLSRILAGCAGLDSAGVAATVMTAVRDFGPQPADDDSALIVLRAPEPG
jgi:serine phosphatase RsbU (regulator of sigma subunit)/anti-sigma regulatory factor (Ser/Thr protein kinase)